MSEPWYRRKMTWPIWILCLAIGLPLWLVLFDSVRHIPPTALAIAFLFWLLAMATLAQRMWRARQVSPTAANDIREAKS